MPPDPDPPNPRGRPREAETLRRGRRLWMSEAEWETVRVAAEEAGLTISEWCRRQILQAPTRRGKRADSRKSSGE